MNKNHGKKNPETTNKSKSRYGDRERERERVSQLIK
jgi:hypothetical protein